MNGGYFKKLSQEMGKLINLKHLTVSCYDQGLAFPKGIGKLISLITLSYLEVCGKDDKEGCTVVGELKKFE